MTPDKAFDLVGRYARLTKQIKDCKRRIGEHLELCNGISGERNKMVNGFYVNSRETDSKNREIDLHLTQWYTPDRQGDYGEHAVYEDIGEWSAEECPHCYAAHLVIQERKTARKALGTVKATISRSAA